jgi:D-glycero-D-manno-heptose 1,7-bisphosphate phosphatase
VNSTSRKAVFFDRDGTLMEEVDYCRDPHLVRVFPGVVEGLRELRKGGWKRIVVTNQSGIARGLILPQEYEAVQAEFLRQCEGEIDAVYFCPAGPEENDPRRKPATGMVEEALAEHGVTREGSWMVGDKAADIDCGRAAGLQTILVETGYGKQQAAEVRARASLVRPDAASAMAVILGDG